MGVKNIVTKLELRVRVVKGKNILSVFTSE